MHRYLTWCLCLLLGIALVLPQAAMSAWYHADQPHVDEPCLVEALVQPDGATHGGIDEKNDYQGAVTCSTSCAACGGALSRLAANPPSLPEPQGLLMAMPSIAMPDRPDRPPRT